MPRVRVASVPFVTVVSPLTALLAGFSSWVLVWRILPCTLPAVNKSVVTVLRSWGPRREGRKPWKTKRLESARFLPWLGLLLDSFCIGWTLPERWILSHGSEIFGFLDRPRKLFEVIFRHKLGQDTRGVPRGRQHDVIMVVLWTGQWFGNRVWRVRLLRFLEYHLFFPLPNVFFTKLRFRNWLGVRAFGRITHK